MQKAHDASMNDYWRNKPEVSTPIVAEKKNQLEQAVDTIDDRVIVLDLTKANQTDLLQTIKTVTYNTETGVWVYTWWNGSTLTIDQNIEKIPVSFSMSPQGIITMTTSDGTQYTCDIATLIKTYSFLDSDTLDFTDTVDSDGNHTITADIKNGSVTGEKLQPNYLADCVLAKQGAESAEANAQTSKETALTHQYNAEAWAKGTKNSVPVTPTDEQYHDNAYYWAQQARAIVGDKVDSFNGRTGTVVAEDGDYESGMIVPEAGAISGQVPVVRNVGTGQDVKLRYVNEDLDIGLKPHIIVISETGSTVTLTKGTKVIYASETSPEHFEADVTEFGTWVIDSVLSGDDAQVSLVVDAVKIYTVDDSHWHADITVTYPTGGTCSCSKSGTTTIYATGSPYTFTVHESGTYTITATANGETYTDTVEVTTSGQTESLTIPEGSTVTPTDSVATLLSCAGIHDTSITSVSDLLADTTTLLAVINSNNAIDYLVRSKTWTGAGLVPTMTSDTTPSGECFGYYIDSNYPAWKSFDKIETAGTGTGFQNHTPLSDIGVGYDFKQAHSIAKYRIYCMQGSASRIATIKLKASNDGVAWTEVDTWVSSTDNGVVKTLSTPISARYMCAFLDTLASGTTAASSALLTEIQYYSENICEDSTAMSYIGLNNYAANTLLGEYNPPLIPIMTSATTPSGSVSSSSTASGYDAYKSFDGNTSTGWLAQGSTTPAWVAYQFETPKVVRKVGVCPITWSGLDSYSQTQKIQAYDGTDWIDLTEVFTWYPYKSSGNPWTYITIDNDTAYSAYRFYVTSVTGSANPSGGSKIQFFEKDDYSAEWLEAICNSTYFESVLNSKVPTMTSSTSPSGECFSTIRPETAYRVFNGDEGTGSSSYWYMSTADGTILGTYIGYMFTASNKVKLLKYLSKSMSGYARKSCNFTLQGSNDNSTWTDIGTFADTGTDSKQSFMFSSNVTLYTYYRIVCKSANGNMTYNSSLNMILITELQFYGREDV